MNTKTSNFGPTDATSAYADLGYSSVGADSFGASMKVCFKCKRELPVSDFYHHPMMGDGHLGKCKECTKRDVKEGREKRRVYYSFYEMVRFQRPERKAAIKQYAQKRVLVHPDRVRANRLTSNAIRDGRLVRLPCEICGAKAQAHHDDYSKPLEVRWLCFKHHRELAHGQVVVAF